MNLNIAVITGDGVGPEMTEAALLVLRRVCRQYGHQLKLTPVLASAAAIEACDNPLPEDSLAICKQADAVLFGNTGLKKYQNNPLEKRPEYALLRLRRELAVTTNIRPVHVYPALLELSPLKRELIQQGFDFVFVRDIVGGVFCSDKVMAKGRDGLEAYEFEYYNEKIIEDTVRVAFELALIRGCQVTSLDKANVLESSRLWRKTVSRISEEYPSIRLRHRYIDSAAMEILANPADFDVIVTSNLFGDIISDEGTQMTGTVRLYGSAEVAKDRKGIYTPNQLHVPDESMIGRHIVNPIGMIAAVALMLRHSFGLEMEAKGVEAAIEAALAAGYGTADIRIDGSRILSTMEMAEVIGNQLTHANPT